MREHDEQRAVEKIRRAIAALDKLVEDLPTGHELWAVAHDARTDLRDALAAIGADPWFGD